MSTPIPSTISSPTPENPIRLRRTPSLTSSINTTTATITTTNSTSNYNSTTSLLARPFTSTTTHPLNPAQTFTPTHSFQIQARGHTRTSPVTGNLDLQTPIFALPVHTLFTDLPILTEVVSIPRYLSIRPSRSSGTCNLVSPESTSPLATTTYRYGIGKPPVIKFFPSNSNPNLSQDALEEGEGEEESISLQNKSFFSRAVSLPSKSFGLLTWRYASSSERRVVSSSDSTYGDVSNLLLLENGDGKVVARFVRGERTRTEGSGKSSAGNGGLLEIMMGGMEGEENRNRLEVLCIASCLVMLKKEVDRLRGVQAAAVGFAST